MRRSRRIPKHGYYYFYYYYYIRVDENLIFRTRFRIIDAVPRQSVSPSPHLPPRRLFASRETLCNSVFKISSPRRVWQIWQKHILQNVTWRDRGRCNNIIMMYKYAFKLIKCKIGEFRFFICYTKRIMCLFEKRCQKQRFSNCGSFFGRSRTFFWI